MPTAISATSAATRPSIGRLGAAGDLASTRVPIAYAPQTISARNAANGMYIRRSAAISVASGRMLDDGASAANQTTAGKDHARFRMTPTMVTARSASKGSAYGRTSTTDRDIGHPS